MAHIKFKRIQITMTNKVNSIVVWNKELGNLLEQQYGDNWSKSYNRKALGKHWDIRLQKGTDMLKSWKEMPTTKSESHWNYLYI